MSERFTEVVSNPSRSKVIFEQYCGEGLRGKFCLVTTHWDRVQDMEVATLRETEIREEYCASGAPMSRFLCTRESAWQAVEIHKLAISTKSFRNQA